MSQATTRKSISLSSLPAVPPTIVTTLRSLYNRAARAFLNRDISLTHSLLESAFALIDPPPPVFETDSLNAYRKKWDILRITLETTVKSSPPPAAGKLPDALHELIVQTPHNVVNSMYGRSLELYTPQSWNGKSASVRDAGYLPSQVLTALVYSSLKLDCPEVGREIIEDWLGKRRVEQQDDGYPKILELYCLQVLPKLGEWEYAKEFLDYESELSVKERASLQTMLKKAEQEAIQLHAPLVSSNGSVPSISPSPLTDPSSPHRPHSPAPSSSSSSSLSTTSTHTVVPSTPRPIRGVQSPGLSSFTSIPAASRSTASVSSQGTVKQNGHAQGDVKRPYKSKPRTHSSATPHPLTLSRSQPPAPSALRPANPSTLALVKEALSQYLTANKLNPFLVLVVIVVPFLSFVLRMRRRRTALAGGSTVDVVKKRLQAGEAGLMWRAWSELVRAIGDTVRMGGSGLV